MRIDSVEFFYAAMPAVTLEADGSQDALLVRVVADDVVGWGECEASPLVSLAAFVTPRSHGVCQPVSASVLGERIDSPADIARISANVARNSMDLLQAPHTYSGIEMALWDLLGHARQEPVWRLLGYDATHPKTAYASLLFGDTPQETLVRARDAVARGFRAAKFGWGPFGEGTPDDDADQLYAAREGLGDETTLLVDAGQIFGEDVEAAALRIPALEATRVTWLEEPFQAHAYSEHADLAARTRTVRIAGGEGAHNLHMARNLVDFGSIGFLQIDTGRIGGIGPAKAAADYAARKEVTFVNHTFTSHLALSASLQPFAGLADHRICEYPAAPKALAVDLTHEHLVPDAEGRVAAPDLPGLGVSVDLDGLAGYLKDVEIVLDGEQLYRSPGVGAVAAGARTSGGA